MSAVNITSVNILNNPQFFPEPLQFEIQYECNTELQHDLEWRVTYVGSADSEEYDQVLDSVLVGPVGPGQYKFVLQTDAPDSTKLPQDDIVGITVILLTCLYQDKEFLRVGYYVNNDYQDEESRENPPTPPQIGRLVRSILADKPRVTRFPIEWDQPQQIPTVGGDPVASVSEDQMQEDIGFPQQENIPFQFPNAGGFGATHNPLVGSGTPLTKKVESWDLNDRMAE